MMNFKFLSKFLVFASLVFAEEKPIVVLITSYNNENLVQRNLQSVIRQQYSNYRVIYVDDCSTDHTKEIAERLLEKLPKEHWTLISNPKRIGSMANVYYAIHSCRDEEIIVSLDGDDWLAHGDVLQRINETYTSPDVWLTHGTFIEYPNGSTEWSIPIPQEIVAAGNFRTYRCPSHLRTFYAWLFKQVRQEDFFYEGKFLEMTWDQAAMFPMIEMAGERHRFIKEVLYVYNVANPINDNKVNAELQRNLEAYIRSKPPYPRLDKSPLN